MEHKYRIGQPLLCYETRYGDGMNLVFGAIVDILCDYEGKSKYCVQWCDENYLYNYSEQSIIEYMNVLEDFKKENK